MSDPTVREDLMRGLEKQKLSQKPMSGDERGAAEAAQMLNSALIGFGDDAAGAIDFLDDVIRGRQPDYAAAIDKAAVLRQRLAQQFPNKSALSRAIGGAGLGALAGGYFGYPVIGGTAGAIVNGKADPTEGRTKRNDYRSRGVSAPLEKSYSHKKANQ